MSRPPPLLKSHFEDLSQSTQDQQHLFSEIEAIRVDDVSLKAQVLLMNNRIASSPCTMSGLIVQDSKQTTDFQMKDRQSAVDRLQALANKAWSASGESSFSPREFLFVKAEVANFKALEQHVLEIVSVDEAGYGEVTQAVIRFYKSFAMEFYKNSVGVRHEGDEKEYCNISTFGSALRIIRQELDFERFGIRIAEVECAKGNSSLLRITDPFMVIRRESSEENRAVWSAWLDQIEEAVSTAHRHYAECLKDSEPDLHCTSIFFYEVIEGIRDRAKRIKSDPRMFERCPYQGFACRVSKVLVDVKQIILKRTPSSYSGLPREFKG